MREGRYTYRQAVPTDVRDVIGRAEFYRYLGAIAKHAAETEARKLRLHFDGVVDRVRALSPKERAEIIKAGGLERHDKRNAAVLTLMRAAVDSKGPLYDPDIDADHDAASRALAAEQTLSTLEARKTLADMEAAAPRSSRRQPLQTIHDVWKERVRPKSQSTIDKAQLWLDRLSDFTNGKPVDQITVADARAFRTQAEKAGEYNRETAKTGLGKLRTMFSHAVDTGLIDQNPFAAVRVFVPAPDTYAEALKDKGMTREQVKTALDNMHKLAKRRDDLRWCLKFMFWHGLRCEEFACLRTRDLVVKEGIQCMVITDAADPGAQRSVKTGSSFRTIPIHSAVCAEFLAYVATIKTGKTDDLFEGKTPGHKARRIQRRLNPYLKSLGLPSLHAARHTFKTACVEAGVPAEIAARLMGHQLQGVHYAYGSAPSIKVLHNWLEKVKPT